MLDLAKAQSQKIEAGHTYFVGASDSPKLLLVLAVEENRVRVVNPYGETMRSYAIVRREAELLAARGHRTMVAKAERMAGLYAQHGRVQAALHGAPAKPRDFDVYTASLRPVSGKWDSDANWRAAEEYGNVGGCIATELLDVMRVRGSELAKLMADERFVVVKVELTEECARK